MPMRAPDPIVGPGEPHARAAPLPDRIAPGGTLTHASRAESTRRC
ncbi:hypothetical protein [Methylobacterium variabile]|jgi:hypothetical protein|nr:hypothetical protein [Methylobacterium variabile]